MRPRKFICAILVGFGLILAGVSLSSRSACAQNPVPFISAPLVPTSVAPGGADFKLTVNGTGFVPSSVVTWNGSPRKTQFISNSQLVATIPASDIATATTTWVGVSTPAACVKNSNQLFFTVTVPSTSVSFSRVDYGSVRDNIQVVTADFNRDGILDLATASWDDSLTATFIGNPDGTFQPYQSYSFSWGDHSLVAANFNRDHFMDLIVGLRGSGDLGILMGHGDGTFTQKTLHVGLATPYALAFGDFNSDGALDLVASNEGSNSVSVFLQQPTGFQKHGNYSIGRTALMVAVGDFNKDGHLDLAVSTDDDDLITVLLGKGDGTFEPPQYYASGNQPAYYLAIADLNGDNNLDLVTANLNGQVSVLLGKEDGTFASAHSYAAGGHSISAAIADLNGDGKLDLVTANYDSATVSVMLGNGDGTFQAAQQFPAIAGARGLAIGDFDRDGRLDLAVGNQGASSLSIFLQNGD